MDNKHSFSHRDYLIVGNGRIAKHFAHYLQLLEISYYQWSRKQNTVDELRILSDASSRVLLLISDRSIAPFVETHNFILKNKLIHFSGACSFSFATGAHPLNTFGDTLYELDTYKNTPFVIEPNTDSFSHLMPGLSNPHYTLANELKPLYHALCVFSGNFSTLLWQNTMERFEAELHLPRHILIPYLVQNAKNVIDDPSRALTGPLIRKDNSTVLKNLQALKGSPEEKLYQAFVDYFSNRNQLPEVKHEHP